MKKHKAKRHTDCIAVSWRNKLRAGRLHVGMEDGKAARRVISLKQWFSTRDEFAAGGRSTASGNTLSQLGNAAGI